VTIREGLPKLLAAFLRDICAMELQKSEFCQPFEMFESGIRDLRAVEVL